MNNHEKGQSLIELLVAMAVFVLIISAITFLVLDSYIAHRAGREETIATLLAEEGLEAARSIRDNDWNDLVDGNHGIATTVDSWIFQGTEEDIDQLKEGKRKIIVSSIDNSRKEVKSQITWEFSADRPREIILVTYLTHWQREIPSEGCWGTGGFCDILCQYSDYGSLTDYYTDPDCSDSCPPAGSFYLNPSGVCSSDGTGLCYKMETSLPQYTSCVQGTGCEADCGGTCTSCADFDNSTQCNAQDGCNWRGRCRGECTPCENFPEPACEDQSGCSWGAIKWYWDLRDSQEGYPSYISCEWYVQ